MKNEENVQDDMERRKEKAERKSNMELLRIISMVMIVLHHYADHGGFVFSNGEITINRVILQAVHLFGKMGICVFVLISGYFMVESEFRWRKALKLVMEVQFYALLCFGLTVLSGDVEFTWERLFISVFPVTNSLYWFVTTYMVFYFLTPYLNVMIHHLTKRQHFSLLLFLLVIWSVIPTFLRIDICYSQLGLFILLYLTAAYIRLYPDVEGLKRFGKLRYFFACYGFIFLTVLFLDLLEYLIPEFSLDMEYFGGQNKITTYLCALSMFIAFLNMDVRQNKWINGVASTTFGVYLLHDNTFISRLLWTEWLDTDALIHSYKLLPHLILAAGCVFAGCAVIDQMRQMFLERPLQKILRKVKLPIIIKEK